MRENSSDSTCSKADDQGQCHEHIVPSSPLTLDPPHPYSCPWPLTKPKALLRKIVPEGKAHRKLTINYLIPDDYC